jgi:hypothetical protein
LRGREPKPSPMRRRTYADLAVCACFTATGVKKLSQNKARKGFTAGKNGGRISSPCYFTDCTSVSKTCRLGQEITDAARRAVQDDCKSWLSAPLEILQFLQDGLSHSVRKSWKKVRGGFLKSRRSALIQTLRACALWCKHRRPS